MTNGLMNLTSTITNYDADWPRQYAAAAERLRSVFGAALLELHHVGSTAVPGLAAKPEIDILVVVRDVADAGVWQADLAPLGYRRGNDLSAGHLFFKRDVNGIRTHKVHICKAWHSKIGELLEFRDRLRRDSAVKEQYERLKYQLERDNTQGIGEYLKGKAPFVEAVLKSQVEE